MTPSATALPEHRQPLLARWSAYFFSCLFHPLFVPVYATLFLLYIHPSYFNGFGDPAKKRILLIITLNAVFYPLIVVLLLKGLGFSKSIFLRTQQERIVPYICSMIFFFWTYYVLREQEEIPRILVSFMFGVFIASAAALIANIYFKVSMHAIGMGGMLGFLLVIMQQHTMMMTGSLCIGLLIAGAVCTSRLTISDHSSKEIYTGLLIGLLCQFAGSVVGIFS